MPDRPVQSKVDVADGYGAAPYLVTLTSISQTPININELAEFFKDSPWEVTTRDFGGKTWYVWRRRYVQEGSQTVQEGPIVYLTEVLENTPPLLYHPFSKHETELLLIPLSNTSAPNAYVDTQNNTVAFGEYYGACSFPTYLVVPKELKLVPDEIIMGSDKYKPIILHGEPDRDQFHNILNAQNKETGSIITGLQMAIHPSCIAGEKQAGDHIETPPEEKDTFMRTAAKACLLYDTSGSMAGVGQKRLHGLMAEHLSRELFHALDLYGMKKAYREEHKGFGYVEGELEKLSFYLPIGGIKGNSVTSVALIMSAAEFIALPRLKECFDSDSCRPSNEFDLVDQEKLAEIISKQFSLLPDDGSTLGGPDADEEAIKKVKDGCIKNQGTYYYITDTKWRDATIPAVVIKRDEDSNFSLQKRGETVPLADKDKMVEWAIRHKLPLFIATILFEEAQEAGEQVNIEDVESSFYRLLPTLVGLPSSEREKWYAPIKEIVTSEKYDVHVRKRCVALLTTWGIEKDGEAQKTLWDISGTAENLDVRVNKYLAKCLSLFADNAKAKELLSYIKDNPTSPKTTFYLTILSGHKEFKEALEFILNETWNMSLVDNLHYGGLLENLETIFIDPVLLYRHPEGMDSDAIARLAGINWGVVTLQGLFGLLNQRTLPYFAPGIQNIAGAMSAYAEMVLNPPWEQGERLTLNPIPERRYYYNLSSDAFEMQLQQMVYSAKYEGSWIHFGDLDKHGFAFDSGLLSNWGSVSQKYDWPHVAKALPPSFNKPDSEMTISHAHLHPPVDSSLPERLYTFPSSGDLKAWFVFMVEARKRYPHAKFEFIIVSEVGITRLFPTHRLVEEVDDLLKEVRNGKEISIPDLLEEKIDKYIEEVDRNLGYTQEGTVKDILDYYFEIDLPKRAGSEIEE